MAKKLEFSFKELELLNKLLYEHALTEGSDLKLCISLRVKLSDITPVAEKQTKGFKL